MESRTIERGQLIALDRINTQDMRVNQSSGRITASGPGWVSSVRRAGNNPLMAVGAPPRAQPVQPKRDGLEYLRADFQHGIEGNLHDRAVALVGNVKCVYGPVKDWQQTLSTDNPDKLGESGVILSCDRITLVEVNPAQTGRGTMEMEALGNTLIEGSTFTARANRVAYAQAKDLIVLEGTGQTDAHLWRQTSPGAPMAHAAARKIMYWRSRNSVEVDDARFLDLSQFPKKPQPQSPSRQPAGNPPTGRGVDTRGRY